MHEPTISVTGIVAVVPALRTLASGTSVSGFRVAATPRRLDKGSGEWSDGETLWFGVTCWRSLAQHCAESLKKGDRVVVIGRLVARTWRTETGEERSGLEIDATSVGFDLTRVAAAPLRPVAPTVVSDPGPGVSGPPPEALDDTSEEDPAEIAA